MMPGVSQKSRPGLFQVLLNFLGSILLRLGVFLAASLRFLRLRLPDGLGRITPTVGSLPMVLP